ncbi:MAG: hypothetical protein ACPHVX_05995 [Flavobacteriaceae bacterium]
MDLKAKILENIEKFSVSEFCKDGGWPNFENLDLLVFDKQTQGDFVFYDIELVYECTQPGGCFIPAVNAHTRLRKKLKVSKNTFEVLS